MKMSRPLAGRLAGLAFALALVAVAAPATAAEPPAAATDTELAPLKRLQQRVMLARLQGKLERQQRLATLHRSGARPWLPPQATAGRRPKREPLPAFPGLDAADRAVPGAAADPLPSLLALAPNVRLNNRASDVSPTTTGQSEISIAARGSNVLAAWNDGDGFNRTAPNDDVMGYAYSTNGGVSFVDGGTPPKLANWTYVSDPVITINEKTGEFYFSSLFDSLGFNGVAVVRATFSGGGVVWGTPTAVRKVNSSFSILDKQWVVADSATGYVYVIYTNFNNTTGTQTDFNRSPNGTGWVASQKLNTTGDNLVTPGARVITGPAGELYAIWPKIGPVDQDFFIVRKSVNNGATWGAEVTLPGYFSNFGSGAPGFNRERGITTPAVAIDRTFGPDRGRLYVTWNESVNFFDDPTAGPGSLSEPEAPAASGLNDTPGSATAATVGVTLRGSLGTAADIDYFAVALTQGQTYVFYCDSTASSLDLSYRMICSDGVTRLAISNFGVGAGGLIIFTAPTTATYHLRILDFGGSTGPYRVRTNTITNGPNNRARDHRDVFVTSSATGAAWSTPTRVNQSPVGYDDWLPEVAVDAKFGKPEVVWYDWRDTPPANCGGYSHVYFAFSNDAGATWNEAGVVTDTQTNWTSTQSNIAPNQGDYLGFHADSVYAYVAWGDGRSGDVDAFAAAVPLIPTPVL
ncbi:MAG: hypothetical protein MUE34_17645, partial [Acidimicrobiales bacterium]|nr:hypothetical protein [Acidimicrobiales bacterium]